MLQGPSFPLFTWLFFLFILFICWRRSKAKGQVHRLPPGPWKLPLIGNLHQLAFSSLLHHTLTDLAKKYGPFMQLQLGEVPAIVVSSPELAKEVMKTHDPAFANRPTVPAVEILTYDRSGVVFTPYGDYWRQMRKICVMELLSAKRVQSFKSVREEEVSNLIESIFFSGGLPFNLSEKIFSLTNRIASRAAFGKKCKYEKDIISSVKEVFSLSGGFAVSDLFPSLKFLGFLTGMKPAAERLHKRIDKILDSIIEDKMQRNAATSASKDDSGDHDDVVDVLLELAETGGLDSTITKTHIKAVTLDLLAGATETSATTIEWAMSELLRNPRAMEKAQAEVRQVLEGRSNIDESDLEKLDFLKLVVKETLRLHPPGALNPRESREKCEVGGYVIPSNMKVIINVWAIGRDREYWIDANCFRPERFHGSSIDFKGADFEFIPFGGVRRICPGISFAVAAIELTLAQLLYHFNWKLPNEIRPEDLDMSELLDLSCKRRNALSLIATPWISSQLKDTA